MPERLLATLRLDKWQPAKEARVEAGLARTPYCDSDHPGEQKLEVAVPRGQAMPVYLSIRADELPQQEYALLRVLETEDGKVVGGVTYVLISADEKGSEHASNEEYAS